MTGSAIFGFGPWLFGTRSGLVTLALATALFVAGCVTTPTDTYYACNPSCFMDCQASHMERKALWDRDTAIDMADYCHQMKMQCVKCIERIEQEGNACGWSKPCPKSEGTQ